jgi:radical SAM superfamily enzyme YgiQ (UPF0313 family)
MVYPQYPDTFWSFKYALNIISKKAMYPPLGLLTVAAMLPGDWEKKLIDMNVTSLADKDILWADYVFISAMQVQTKSVKEVISKCNKLSRKVVAGGPLFTISHGDFDGVSHFVLGEAESTLPSFLSDLTSNCAKDIYESNERPELNKTPLPMWSLINMKDYASMNVQYSRGCPFDCEFCDIVVLFGRKPRTKSSYQLIDELETLYKNNWHGEVLIVDDNLIGNKQKLKREILPAIIEWSKSKQYPFYFMAQVSIDLADDEELMNLMIEAGISLIFVGIESPNENSLVECNKMQNKNRDLVVSVNNLQNHGFEVEGGFIVGFDNDTSSIFESHIDFIQRSGIVTAMVGLLNAPPGTRLYQRLKEENRLIDDSSGDNTDCSINFIPKMNRDVLINGYMHVLNTIYSSDYYSRRIQTFYKEYHPKKKQGSTVEFNYIISLLKALWILGIAEDGRQDFWKFFIFSLFKYPQFFWLSMSYSIYRRHFYRHAQKLLET